MSKIKDIVIRLDERDMERTDENMIALLKEDEFRLNAYRDSLEGQLAGYTTEQLQNEVWRRQSEPLDLAMKELRDASDKLNAHMEQFKNG